MTAARQNESPAVGATQADRQEKTQATVFAEAALRGISVYPLADGTFIASKWGWIKPCADLSAVQHLVRQIGGAA